MRTRTLLMIGVLAFVATAVLWRLGDARFSVRRDFLTARTSTPPLATTFSNLVVPRLPVVPAGVAATLGTSATPRTVVGAVEAKGLRLANTDRSVDELARDDRALVLRNASIDTASGKALEIPEHLTAGEEPGAYVVQARGAVSTEFRDVLQNLGARFVSYVPVNAYLVAATAAQAARLREQAVVAAVVPYEPYFKLEPGLLGRAVRDEAVGAEEKLIVTVLPGSDSGTLTQAGATVRAEFVTPFGPGYLVEAGGMSLAALARVSDVQGIEPFRQRQLLNDRARETFGISVGTNAPGAYTNYLGLTGTNVVVNVNDSGIDEAHPDLAQRVKADSPSTLVDFDGHGTHVAATIAGSGSMSGSVSNAPGSIVPGADFRGMAPAAELFALPIDLNTGPLISDAYLQQTAATNYYVTQARTNLLISNNSWGYINAFEYTVASASYDAAVRDALPSMSGSQPILYVFAAGNEGSGSADGQGGEPNTVRAPGTGKNVITVGAVESLREITNEVVSILPDGTFTTNQVFLGETDTADQITAFSGRGNVEPGVEGAFGRFKPDVVAPGAFTISARSSDWVDPEFFSSVQVNRIERQTVSPGNRIDYTLFVGDRVSEFRIRLLRNERSPDPLPGLPMYLRYGAIPTTGDLIGTNNIIRVPPDATVSSGDWYYSVGNFGDRAVSYDLQTMVVITNGNFGYFEQLKLLNSGLAPNYRFESGTSMAAPAVSGLLALYQDYFQREKRPVTPALLKALLINGARSLGSHYNFSLRDVLNLQGWGGANITNALPAGEFGSSTGSVHAVQFTDQTGTNAITTGQSRTWRVSVSPEAVDQILKFSLVWTDPPGNPVSGIKLVNDLDLVVRNEATGEEYHGNDMPYRSDFNVAHAAGTSVTNDIVNNVENVLVRPPVGSNYLVTVVGRRVNVNAVHEHPDGIAQDFALVASVANTRLTNVLDIRLESQPDPARAPVIATLTNGLPIIRTRAGAMPPRFGVQPGSSNQWSFYVFTNLQANTPPGLGITNGQYVAFLTFGALNLSRAREGGADIDLFATTDPAITNLNPVAIENALKSTKSGGIETIVLTNAPLGAVYYLGVKAEDQEAAEFTIAGISSNTPFDEDDGQGNRIVRGLPYFVPIPDGSPDEPQMGFVFGIVTTSFQVRQVTVTNTVMFDSTGDLLFNLAHETAFAVLGNHELDPLGQGGVETSVYDDSGAGVGIGRLVGRPSDGPGTLQSFVGMEAAGAWILTVTDNALTQVATNVAMTLFVQREPEDDSLFFTLRPGEWGRRSRNLPPPTTNMIVRVTDISGGGSPLEVYARRLLPPSLVEYDKGAILPSGASNGELTLGLGDVPPLNPGLYHAGVYNPGPDVMTFALRIDYEVDPNLAGDRGYATTAPLPLRDDAVIRSSIPVFDDRIISDVRVGIRVDHPRVSDLAFRLISPQGIRLMLAENRGGEAGTAYGTERGATRIYTTFTDDTNLTTIPIKFGLPAFTNSPKASTASNRVVMADSFDTAVSRIYSAGETIVPGWRVLAGQASVVRVPIGATNRYDGDQYMVLGNGQSSVGTNLVLTPGSLYRLRFGAGRLAGNLPQGIQVYLDGLLIHELKSDTLRLGWYQSSFLFGATQRQSLLEFRTIGGTGRLPLAVDGVVIDEADPPLNSFYLPEERLKPLIGQRALGDWQLEITDTRSGPTGTNTGVLHGWRLELDFDYDGFNAIRLTNGVPYFGSVNEDEIQYFYVDTPVCASLSVNTLAGELATLLLYGDRDGLPKADLAEFVDDYGPYINVEAGGRATLTLTTNFPASAPLRPGQRYFLAVRNYQPDRVANPFGIMVQFDCEDPPLPVVPSLTNGIPVTGTIDPGPGLHYYQFVVSSNAISAEFELTPTSGNNVDMYIKRGRITPPDPLDPQPLPTPNVFDYRSELPGGTDIDLVTVGRTSTPEGLVPGVWFIGVRNGDVVPAQYSLKVTEAYTTIVNLTNGIAFTNTIAPPIDPFLGVQGDEQQYYAFLVSSNSVQATFETTGADGNVDLYVRRGLPIPTPFDFHFASQNAGTLSEFIAVTNTTTPIWLAPGWWFLSVANADVTNVTYSIRATETAGVVVPLVNDVAVTNTIGPGPTPDYYSFTVSPSALSARFELYGMSSDVNLLLRRGLPLPTPNDYTYFSFAPGIVDEFIELTPFSFPTGLTPGDWYLSVLNPGAGNATYTVKASESTAVVTPLTNGVPYNAAIPPGGNLDYYQFLVETNALAAEFKLTSAGAGNLDLFLRKGPPLPDAGNAHYTSATAGTADESIRLEPNSAPVPLSPGLWYLSVTNHEATVIGYEITATQFGVEPPPISGNVTNIVITDTNICITWVSIPSTNYYVVAKTNALDAVWTPVSPTLTAVDTSTTWCLEPPGPWRFFDVLEGESPVVPIPDPVPVLRLDGSNICVAFASVVGTNYHIQAKKVSTDPAWITITSRITATSTLTEVCYPLEWGYRFFRVGVGELEPPAPTPLDPESVSVEITVDNLCVSWPTQAGLDYLVEAKREATDPNWSVISEPIRGDGNPARLCLDGATEFRFFRVIEGVAVLPGAPPSVPVPNFRLTADAAFQLCLVWDTLLGAEYFVEAKQRFTDPSWTVVSPILTASGVQLSYCVPLSSAWRYYQIRRVNRAPSEPPRIADIEVVPTGLMLRWTGSAGARYQVFYTDTFPATWRPAGAAVTSLTGAFEYLDTGAATGGLSGFRVYRIEMLP